MAERYKRIEGRDRGAVQVCCEMDNTRVIDSAYDARGRRWLRARRCLTCGTVYVTEEHLIA